VCWKGRDNKRRRETSFFLLLAKTTLARFVSLGFLGTLDEKHDLTPLRRSAELGFAFAQAWMSGWTEGKEAFEFAQLAAAQGERDGFYALGWCFLFCKDFQRDQNKAKENFLLASETWSCFGDE
jgi:hypothetical protein